jgi:hypothetical protein
MFSSSALIHVHEEKSFIAHMRKIFLLYTGEEYQFRLGIYLTNQRYVQEFNARQSINGFKLGMNSLSTLIPTEYKVLLDSTRRASPDILKKARALVPKKDKVSYPPE